MSCRPKRSNRLPVGRCQLRNGTTPRWRAVEPITGRGAERWQPRREGVAAGDDFSAGGFHLCRRTRRPGLRTESGPPWRQYYRLCLSGADDRSEMADAAHGDRTEGQAHCLRFQPKGSTAAQHRLPTISLYKDHVLAGCLISYGQNVAEFHRRAAIYVDKILKGTKPQDLPVEQPTKFDMVINP